MTSLQYPGRTELVDSRRLLGAVGGALLCTGAGAVIVWSGSVLGWLAVAMGAMAFVFMTAMVISPVSLVIEADGLTLRSPLGGQLIAWEDTSDFDVRRIPLSGFGARQMISFSDRNHRSRQTIPAQFEIDARTLAAELEQYRSDALSAR